MAFNEGLVSSLILNASYEPIRVVNWRKALLLLFTDKVEILEYHTSFVSSPSIRMQLPSVLKFKRYIKGFFPDKVRFCRENIYLRDNFTCQYCHKKFSFQKLTIDHVIPVSKGGENTWTNVVTACSPCNNKKGAKTLKQFGKKLQTKPVRPKYLPKKSISKNLVPDTWLDYLPG